VPNQYQSHNLLILWNYINRSDINDRSKLVSYTKKWLLS